MTSAQIAIGPNFLLTLKGSALLKSDRKVRFSKHPKPNYPPPPYIWPAEYEDPAY